MAVKDNGAFDVASRFNRCAWADQNRAAGCIEGGRAHHGVFCHQNLVCRSIGVGGRCRRKGAEVPSRHQRVHIQQELLSELGKQVVGMDDHAGLTLQLHSCGVVCRWRPRLG